MSTKKKPSKTRRIKKSKPLPPTLDICPHCGRTSFYLIDNCCSRNELFSLTEEQRECRGCGNIYYVVYKQIAITDYMVRLEDREEII